MPSSTASCPLPTGVLESLVQQDPRILMAYSMDELLRVIHANLCIAAHRDRLEGRFFQPECHQP